MFRSWMGRSAGEQISGKPHLLPQTRGTTAKAEKCAKWGAEAPSSRDSRAGVGLCGSGGAQQTRGQERTRRLLAQLKQSRDEWGYRALLSCVRGPVLSKRAGGLRECQVSLTAPCFLISMYSGPLGKSSVKPGSIHDACQRKGG